MTEAAKRQCLLKDPVQLGNLAAARVEAQHLHKTWDIAEMRSVVSPQMKHFKLHYK